MKTRQSRMARAASDSERRRSRHTRASDASRQPPPTRAVPRIDLSAREALDALTGHVCLLDANGIIVFVNRAWRAFSRRNSPVRGGVEVGASYFDACRAVTGSDAVMARDALKGLRAVAIGTSHEYVLEYPCHSPDVMRWFEMRATRLAFEGRVHLLVTHFECTERKVVERALQAKALEVQALSNALVEAQEAERRRLARELHDEIGQTLTLLKIELDTLTRHPTTAATDFAGLSNLVQGLIAAVRDLSFELRPSLLDDLGLVPALLWLFDRLEDRVNLAVAFRQRGLDGRRLHPSLEIAVYRLVQEALTNVLRHAGTPRASVRLRADSKVVQVDVADRGAGFDTRAALAEGPCVGLHGMRERVNALGGRWTIESTPGAGTRVRAILPLARAG